MLGAYIGIHESGKLIHARYNFDESEDSYNFGAVLGEVRQSELPKLAEKVLTSEPIRGLTERVIKDKLVALGHRDGLKSLSDMEIQRGFQDEVTRIGTAYNLYNQISGSLDETESTEQKGIWKNTKYRR